jgi:hypothetical protein
MTKISLGNIGATTSVGGVGGSGAGQSTGALAGAMMSSLAAKVAQNIGNALNLPGTGASPWQGNGNDPYEIAELVDSLKGEVQGTPADAGELSRALHAFVQESAALFAARPESGSLQQLQNAVAQMSANGGTPTLAGLTKKIDGATQVIGSGAR